MTKLIERPEWQPSEKLYYDKYECNVRLGPYDDRSSFKLKPYLASVTEDIDYRSRKTTLYDWPSRYDMIKGYDDMKFIHYMNIYTNHHGFVNYLADSHVVEYIKSPASNEHADVMRNLDAKEIFKNKPFYGKYTFKVDAYRTYHHSTTDYDVLEACDWAAENFDTDVTKFTNRMGYAWSRTSFGGISRIPHIPFIYTNDESSIMLFKLAFGDKFRVEITKVVTMDNIK